MSYLWNLPTKVLFGAGKVKELGTEKMPGKKALLVVSNGRSVVKNGALAAVEQGLEQAGAAYVLFNKIQSNPLEPTIMEGVQAAREEGCDFIVGLGGGSVLDAAMISAMVPQKKGRLWDYVQGGTGGGRTLTETPLPYIEITTSAGTGSEVDCWGVVTNADTHEKIGFQGGYAARTHCADGVHDDLFAKAICFENESLRVVLVALDVVGITREQFERIRAGIVDRCGTENVIVCATHDHSGPETQSKMRHINGPWCDRMVEEAILAAEEAL